MSKNSTLHGEFEHILGYIYLIKSQCNMIKVENKVRSLPALQIIDFYLLKSALYNILSAYILLTQHNDELI